MLGIAQEVIDVNLQHEGYSYDPKTKLPPVEYIARVYEAQAVLDLYLIEMARRQVKYDLIVPTKDDNKHFACPHLIIEGYPQSPDRPNEEDGEIFILTRLDLRQHLARPGSVTDRFDSPLLFARSGIDIVKRTPSGGRRKRLDMSDDEREQDWADIFSPSSSIFSGSSVSTISLPSPHSATIGSLLTQLRMVLSSTPHLENLSLTGFLERSICGNRSVSSPKAKSAQPRSSASAVVCTDNFRPAWSDQGAPYLRHRATTGGSREHRSEAARSEDAAMVHAQHSRFAELRTRVSEGKDDLNKRRTDQSASCSLRTCLRLKGIVDILVGKSDASTGSAASANPLQLEEEGPVVQKISKDGTDADTSSDLSSGAESPLAEIRLHASDINALLNQAPSAEVRAAWSSASPVQGQARRLLLVESKVKSWGRWWQAANSTCGRLYEDGRQWWEEKGGLVRLPVVKAERVLPDF